LRAELPDVLSISVPNLFAGMMTGPLLWIGQCILAQYHPFGEQAIYSVGSQWRLSIAYLPMLLTTAYLPIASSLDRSDSQGRLRLFYRTACASVIAASFVAVAVGLLAPLILKSYGDGFTAGKATFCILLLVAVTDSLNYILVPTLVASDRTWYRLVGNFVWGAVFVVASLLLIPGQGARGLALSLLIGQLCLIAVQVPLAIRCLRPTAI
jgi:O-antigen/teichoic acid export membrane protein